MASVTSNSAEVSGGLRELADALRLDRNGLGDRVIDATAGAIVTRTKGRQAQPDGTPLAKLKPRTVERKARMGYDPRILVETDVMLQPDQVRGETTVTPSEASMTAGTDDETRLKVDAAHEGSPNRAKRPFYDPGPDGEAAFDAVFLGAIDDAINRAGG